MKINKKPFDTNSNKSTRSYQNPSHRLQDISQNRQTDAHTFIIICALLRLRANKYYSFSIFFLIFHTHTQIDKM